MVKIATFLDLNGVYRVSSPAYGDLAHAGLSDDELLDLAIAKLRVRYSLPANHTIHIVEDADQRQRLAECCGRYYRYPVFPDGEGKRRGYLGAWEMDTDGRPKINMAKARGIQMDYIRQSRNIELVKESRSKVRQFPEIEQLFTTTLKTKLQTLRDIPQTFDLTTANDTPQELQAMWPRDLPRDENNARIAKENGIWRILTR